MWYFLDKNDALQGPFGEDEMRAWYEAGYLAADLMISQTAENESDLRPLQKCSLTAWSRS